MKSNKVRVTLLALALSTSAACAANRRPGVGVVYVARQPPVARIEVISARPGPAHVWISGHWAWGGPAYVWMPGRWEIPRAGFRRYEPGRWVHDRHGWIHRVAGEEHAGARVVDGDRHAFVPGNRHDLQHAAAEFEPGGRGRPAADREELLHGLGRRSGDRDVRKGRELGVARDTVSVTGAPA